MASLESSLRGIKRFGAVLAGKRVRKWRQGLLEESDNSSSASNAEGRAENEGCWCVSVCCSRMVCECVLIKYEVQVLFAAVIAYEDTR